MRGHDGHERVHFKIQVGVSGRDHLMIHELLGCAQMTRQTFFAALDEIARVVHSKIERLLVFPVARRMRAQPGRRRPVTILAANAVSEVEGARALFLRNVQSMTGQAPGSSVRLGKSQNFRHAGSHWIG